jgi:hypothetical protein
MRPFIFQVGSQEQYATRGHTPGFSIDSVDSPKAVRPKQVAAVQVVAEGRQFLDSPVLRVAVLAEVPSVELVVRHAPRDKAAKMLGKL